MPAGASLSLKDHSLVRRDDAVGRSSPITTMIFLF
jgi:hypothetical protein